jgi:hypothetical protein
VHQFAMDVVEDLNRMVEAFGKGTAPDDMLAGSWKDLEAMRWDDFHCSDIAILMFCQGMLSMMYVSGLTRWW